MMTAGQRIYPDQQIEAAGASLRYQGDGNLVLYRRSGPAWASDTSGIAAGYVELQGDGNLVAYDSDGRPYWASNTRAERPELRISTEGLRITGAATVWRIDLPPEPGGPEPLPPMALSRLRVEDNRRWFAHDAGRFDYREITAFSLLSRLLTGEDGYVRDWLAMARGAGFTVARVILTLDGGYWTNSPAGRSFRSAPDMPGYWAALDRLGAIAGEVGIYLRLVFLGAVEPFGGVWYPDRRDVWTGSVRDKGEAFCVETAQRCAGWPHAIYELANEPGQIGMRDSFDALIRLGAKVKAVAPDTLLGLGAADGANGTDVRMAVRPADYVDAHIERTMGVRGFEWVKRSGEYGPIEPEHQPAKMPFISGEPVNFGDWRVDGRNADVERSPSVAFAYAAVSRARQYNTNFHFDGGLWTTMPQAATVECIRAYHLALDAFPMRTGSRWRGHWRESYWRQVWPADDDTRTVEDHVSRGRGPWRVFGTDEYCVAFPEPESWDWRAHVTADIERVAYMPDGAFAAGVYRRT